MIGSLHWPLRDIIVEISTWFRDAMNVEPEGKRDRQLAVIEGAEKA
jgi:hypothetical protein